MITSKNSHAQSYSYTKYNQSIAQARLFFKQGAFAKAFDSFITTHKNTGYELEKDDLTMASQCLIHLLEEAYDSGCYNLTSLEYVGEALLKLKTIQVSETSVELAQQVTAPLFELIQKDLEKNKHNVEILSAYRYVIDKALPSTAIPLELDKLINQLETNLSEAIMRKIKRWYDQQLYTLASIHAEKEIQLLMKFYPSLAKKVHIATIDLFKKHKQCPQRLIEEFSKKEFAEEN